MEDILKQFIKEHREDDIRQLALQAGRYPDVDIPTALTQIAGWQSIRYKVPTWAACDEIIYPPHLPLEQCSSESTAIYKYGIVAKYGNHASLADLTGGFGIDCWFMSHAFLHTTYIERQEELVNITKQNFFTLNAKQSTFFENSVSNLGLSKKKNLLNNVEWHETTDSSFDFILKDSIIWLTENKEKFSWLFIDPARRDGHGGKTVAISDCEPDVSKLEELLVNKASHVMIKLSPMLDLDIALHQLKHVQEAHIVSVDNECKELLLILNKETNTDIQQTPIHCINIKKENIQAFTFSKAKEQQAKYELAKNVGEFLYEPNASILKAGAFRCLTKHYGVKKLHANSHLYTSEIIIPDFPGRIFIVEGSCGFGKKELKALLADTTKANITIRNFPASVAELRKRLHLQEGGDTYLFATTLHPGQKILIKCKR